MAVLMAVLGCGSSGDPPEAALATGAGSAAASVAAAGRGSAAALPAGWRREDLSKLPNRLGASIAVPGDAKLISSQEYDVDADGFTVAVPIVKLASESVELTLTTGAELGWAPTNAADHLAHNKQFKPVTQRTTTTGEFAIVYEREDKSCWLHGASPRAHVVCAADNVPCAQAARWIEVCTSLEPSGAPPKLTAEPGVAFSSAKDPKAGAAAIAVGRAIARNDRAALLAAIGPRGVRLFGKQLSREALGKLLEQDSVQGAFDISCAVNESSNEPECQWNAEGDDSKGQLVVLSRTGYGALPALTFTRDRDGAWTLAKAEVIDLGEP